MTKKVDRETPPPAHCARRGVLSVVVWLVVALIAAGAFAAAFVHAGGTSGVVDLLGSVVVGGQHDVAVGSPRPSAASTLGASSEPTASADLGGLPIAALKRMYAAQLRSQASISALVDNRYSSLAIGTPQVVSNVATVPITAHLRGGGKVAGTLRLQRYDGLWYVFSLENAERDVDVAEVPDVGFDAAVVSVITSQQATPENQDALDKGLLGGGFTQLKVTGVEKGAGTASVDVRFSGGTSKPRTGRFVCITKSDSTTDYWFIARLVAN